MSTRLLNKQAPRSTLRLIPSLPSPVLVLSSVLSNLVPMLVMSLMLVVASVVAVVVIDPAMTDPNNPVAVKEARLSLTITTSQPYDQ